MYNLLAASAVLKNIGYIAIAVLILLVMITVHEAGHYFVGKIFKFKINEFAIGMGPAIFKKKLKSGEDFS
ncbi:MAG: site-2 protease family protein, partial [Eubacteriales bacterium]|nr:site-2 protease family protein [Eubacteriales bacterium]